MTSELTCVQFHGDTIEAVRDDAGTVWVVLRRLCENLGVSMQGQLAKLANQDWVVRNDIITRDTSGRQQTLVAIDLETLPGWLFSINANKVRPEVKDKLRRYQREAAQVLADHFLGQRGGALQPLTAAEQLLACVQQTVDLERRQLAQAREMEAMGRNVVAAVNLATGAMKLIEVARQDSCAALEMSQRALDNSDAAVNIAQSSYGMYTVLAFAKIRKLDMTNAQAIALGRRATWICNERNIEVAQVRDARYGFVGSYPEAIIEDAARQLGWKW